MQTLGADRPDNVGHTTARPPQETPRSTHDPSVTGVVWTVHQPQRVTFSSISVTSAAIGERSERVSVTCANSG